MADPKLFHHGVRQLRQILLFSEIFCKSKPLLLTDLFDNNCCSYLVMHFKIRFNCFFDI